MNIKRNLILWNWEIRYITNTKNKKFVRGKILNLNMINQYDNKNYNKFAISISSKFHKKAVYRNIIRRIFFDIIYHNNYIQKKIKWWYKKVYVSLKKWVEYDVKSKNFKQNVRIDLEYDLKRMFS